MRQVYEDVGEFFHAVKVFFDELAGVGWGALAIALGLHFGKVLLRTVAWRNILRASFPEIRIRRATPVDFVLATAVFLWALSQGVVPSIHTPAFDWGWLLDHGKTTATVVAAVTLAVIWLSWRLAQNADLKQRFGRGFVILRDRRRYLREVASWQLLSWVLRIASLYWFLKAFHVHATIHNALLCQVVDSLSTLLPFSPGGAGTKQGFLVAILHGQAPTSRLLAFSVGQYVAVTIFNVAIGALVIFLMLRTLRLREIIGRAKAAEPERSQDSPDARSHARAA